MEQHASSSRRVLAKIENTSESSAMQPVKLESTKASTGAIPRKKRKFSIKARRSDVNNENRVITARYLQLHDVTDQANAGDESRYSDVEGDHAVYACHECDYTGFYKTWTYHIKGHHGLSTAEYKQKHGEPVFRDKVLHVCKICQKTIIYNRVYLTLHLRQKHDTMPTDYFKMYPNSGNNLQEIRDENTNINVSKENIREFNQDVKTEEARYSGVPADYARKESSREFNQDVKTEEARYSDVPADYARKESSREFNQDVKTEKARYSDVPADYASKKSSRELHQDVKTEEEARYSDVAGDYATYACHECDYSGSYPGLFAHLKKHHATSVRLSKLKHGPLRFVDKVLHICKVCNRSLLYGYLNLRAHLTQQHVLSLAHYVQIYLKNKKEGGQTTNICQEARLDIKDSSTACSRQSNIATVQHRKNKRKAEENPVRKAKKCRITNNRRHSFNDDNISFVNAKKEDSHDVSGTRGSVNFLQTDEGQQPVQEDVKDEYEDSVTTQQQERVMTEMIICDNVIPEGRVKEEIATDSLEQESSSAEEDFSHLDGHAEGSEHEEAFSVYACKECHFSGTYGQLQEHVNQSTHRDHLFVRKLLHACKLCRKVIVYTHEFLAMHLVKLHSELSVAQYLSLTEDEIANRIAGNTSN